MATSTIFKTSILALLVASASGAFADELNLQGYVTGHFGSGNAQSEGGLSYTGSTFNVNTAGGFYGIGNNAGSPNVDNLGSFQLSGSPYSYTGTTFTLDVTFTAPTGINGSPEGVYSAILEGQVRSTTAGGVEVLFNNSPQAFTFNNGSQSGSFNLQVNSASLFPTETTAVTGFGTANAVPEPTSLAAIGMGLGGLLLRRRRKLA